MRDFETSKIPIYSKNLMRLLFLSWLIAKWKWKDLIRPNDVEQYVKCYSYVMLINYVEIFQFCIFIIKKNYIYLRSSFL